MEESVSAADANRQFSKILRGVRQGHSYVITSHGQPVAKVVPVEEDRRVRDAAWRVLLEDLRRQPVIDIGSWTRDELYEDS